MSNIFDLIASVQQTARDNTGNEALGETLWSVEEWLGYFNDAEKEISRRCYAIEDNVIIILTTGTSIYTLNKIVGLSTISLDILDIKDKGQFSYNNSLLEKVTEDYMDKNFPTWRSDSGAPTKFIIYPNANQIRFIPIPTSTYNLSTVTIPIKRLPLLDLSESNPTPEISSRYYEDMKLWALYRAYSKNDVEIELPDGTKQNLSGKYLALFEASVGPRSNANIERIIKEEPSYMRVGVYR